MSAATVTSRLLSVATASLLLAASLGAQGLGQTAVIVQPTYTSLTFGSGAAKRSVDQLALPIVVVLPFSERFNVDISTAFATSTVTAGDSTASEISGLTDTQIRANVSLLGNQVLLTLGVNVPTGQYSVAEDQQEAAGQIGNDFLYYPISSMGNGFAATGGLAYARPAGDWNVGLGASLRKSAEFSAFEVASSEFRFQPADEYRLRLSADRPAGDGQVQLGLTYSMFGEDLADTTTYSTGDRLIATAGWSFPFRGTDVFLSAWNLFRMEGQQLGGDAPKENVFNASAAVSFDAGQILVQPNAELRLWQVGGARAGNLVNLGVRVRIPAGGLSLFPGLGYSMGNVYSVANGDGTKVSGLRFTLTARYN